MSSLGIAINGQWLERYGEWGTPTVTWQWPLGSWELSWTMTQTARTNLQTALWATDRILVDAYIDGLPAWVGSLPIADPASNENRVTYTAIGCAREAEEAVAVGQSSSGYPTVAVPRWAANHAIERGVVTWRNASALPNTSYVTPDTTPDDDTDETDAINYLGALLDAWSQSESKRWAINPERDVIVDVDPTSPDFKAAPNVRALGITTEAAVGRLFARYTNVSGKRATRVYGTGTPEKIVDLTEQGALKTSQVDNRLEGIANRYSRDKIGWKNSFIVVPGQLTTLAGIPAHLGLAGARVARGLMIRIQDQHDPRSPGVYNTDAVVGSAVWDVEADTLELAPVESVEDTFETALQSKNITLLN